MSSDFSVLKRPQIIIHTQQQWAKSTRIKKKTTKNDSSVFVTEYSLTGNPLQ